MRKQMNQNSKLNNINNSISNSGLKELPNKIHEPD